MAWRRIGLPPTKRKSVSSCVALRLPLTGGVVTWFVTGLRTFVRTGVSQDRIPIDDKTHGPRAHGGVIGTATTASRRSATGPAQPRAARAGAHARGQEVITRRMIRQQPGPGTPTGPPPVAPSRAKAGALPGGTVIEVDWAVDANGRRPGRMPPQGRRRAGPPPGHAPPRPAPDARHLRRRPGQNAAQPNPGKRPRHAARRRIAAAALPPPLPARSASGAWSPATASSWSPASGCAPRHLRREDRHRPRRGHPLPASPATAEVSLHLRIGQRPVTRWKAKIHALNPRTCPASPEFVKWW
jgi:hypothetical protein